ncbi:hypothetical protein BUALT_Bualt18G0130500 [Buddleja alternifolia]|uniref:Protein kinase domain-containing protein n=1 Tax=Buddleja alternifolia TaxID=168488 RepID=A0AAV6WFA4_9LAMI|nr:hypothetical protein BUALT_Bualt18G0130500 [Buddleja alternifolia]
MAMAKRGCKEKCGEEVIPYPFGMGKGCYLDEPFEVTCNKIGSASLTWSDAEADSISISTHTLRIKNFEVLPYAFSNKSVENNESLFYLDLNRNHYSISHTRNKFVAMGCDFYAFLTDTNTKEFMGGCATLCNRTDIDTLRSPSCSGLHCCQITLQKDLTSLSLGIMTMNTLLKSWANQCGFFTFVDKDFLGTHKKMKFSECNEIYRVPVIIEWAVGNTSCKIARERGDYVCRQNTDCINYGGTGYRCNCRKGYRDFDECENSNHNKCPEGKRCVNTAGGYYCSPNRRPMFVLLITLGTSLAVGLVLLVAIGLWAWRKLKQINDRKMKQKFYKKNGGLLLQQQISSSEGRVLLELILFPIEELQKATDKFSESRILGKGGLGTVYKGMLSDGRIVAVKKANIIDDSQVGQFINEVVILSQINHRHIVKLLGCCLETEVPLLVYEYVSNGTLSHHLHDEPKSSTFSWDNRLRIAAEIAGALAYLHSCASTAIFHRDVKSSNVLLDENYKAVISDFGLSRSVSTDKTHLTTLVGGTFGYLDPEYFQTGQLNDKSDVYAFGVVLAEILTGQKAISSIKDDSGLAHRFRSAVKENCLFEILENVVAQEGQEEEILAVAKIVMRCLKLNARRRPSMREVAAELEQLRRTKELPGHQESFNDKYGSINERCNSCATDSESEDDQIVS